eukprot:UN32012
MGGSLLNVLHDKIKQSGDLSSRELYMKLLKSASVPYFDMLGSWIFNGVIDDPFDEFMVSERTDITKAMIEVGTTSDEYWNKRYHVRPRHVIKYLIEQEEQILSAGKYLNVIRGSGRDVEFPGEKIFKFEKNDSREVVSKIGEAYTYASKQLLDLLMQEEKLLDRFTSFKSYFFISRGDFFVLFLDSAEQIMGRNASDI